jgi:peptidoglycan/xylan/chitin deacetylase (PgdA/CDA1 family)
MRGLLAAVLLSLLGAWMATPADAQACANPQQALGVSRVVEIDTTGGPLFGRVTRLQKEASFLRRNEVVLTFDDGPVPSITRQILDILDRFCAKATFFPVGRMAIAHPEVVKDVAARGHTLGSHTWSHPKLRNIPLDLAKEEIERGFAAVALAAGRPTAPFFRFPGLGDSEAVVAYLQSRGISTFTVDVVSNDSFIADSEQLARMTVAEIETHQGGIILFHDIKPQTVRALPVVLTALKERGYRIVHLRAKSAYQPLEGHMTALRPLLSKTHPTGAVESSAGLEGLGDDIGAAAADADPRVKTGAEKASKLVPVRSSSTAKRRPPETSPSEAGTSVLPDWAATVQRGRPSAEMR